MRSSHLPAAYGFDRIQLTSVTGPLQLDEDTRRASRVRLLRPISVRTPCSDAHCSKTVAMQAGSWLHASSTIVERKSRSSDFRGEGSRWPLKSPGHLRSEEHTSELQSREN